MSDRIRLTISVSPETHEVFTRMAEAAGISLGKCMGEWLHDTIDGAQFVAQKMEDARKAPRVVMREMQAFAKGLVDEVDASAEELRARGRSDVRSAPRDLSFGVVPPSSNTGGKVPQRGAPAGRARKTGKRS